MSRKSVALKVHNLNDVLLPLVIDKVRYTPGLFSGVTWRWKHSIRRGVLVDKPLKSMHLHQQ